MLIPFLSPFYASTDTFEDISSTDGNITLEDDIPDVDLSFLPKLKYKELNETWYNPKIEMLIIAPDGNQAFVNACKPLMDWKNEKGVKTIILSNYTDYEGSDAQEMIRNMIKDYYEKENIRWVLLAGDAEPGLIPIREVLNPDVVDAGGSNAEYNSWNGYDKPTDFYYSDLTGSWDDDGDNEWGEYRLWVEGADTWKKEYNDDYDEIDWIPDVYVGRFPADDATELEILVNKTLKYEKDPYIGDWMSRMLLSGGVSSKTPLEDEARLTNYIWQHYTFGEMNFTHLWQYESAYDPPVPPSPNQYGDISDDFNTEMNSGYSTVIFAGHGDPTKYLDAWGTIYTNGDAGSISNDYMPSLVYGDACTTSSYDKNDNNIGENLINRPDGGAIGYIGGLRVTWYFEYDDDLEKLNRGCAKLFWEEFFENKKFQQGRALYDSKVAYMESEYFDHGGAEMDEQWQRKNVLTYNLLGDPEVDIYTRIPKNARNPFLDDIYEGQLISENFLDINGESVPYARVHLTSADGKYRTFYADRYGVANFRLLAQANETYNVTITGHNLIPTHFNFTALADEVKPEFIDLTLIPETPSTSNNLCFDVEVVDTYSGIESVFLLIDKADNDFKDFKYFRMKNLTEEDENIYEYVLDKLEPEEYSYMIVARDWANNTKIYYKDSFEFTIEPPITEYILIIASIIVIGVAGISVIIGYKEFRRHKDTFARIERE